MLTLTPVGASPVATRALYQYQAATPESLTRILDDDVNLAVWNRQLPAHIADFSTLLLSLNEPLAESLSLEMPDDEAEPDLHGLASGFRQLADPADRQRRRGVAQGGEMARQRRFRVDSPLAATRCRRAPFDPYPRLVELAAQGLSQVPWLCASQNGFRYAASVATP